MSLIPEFYWTMIVKNLEYIRKEIGLKFFCQWLKRDICDVNHQKVYYRNLNSISSHATLTREYSIRYQFSTITMVGEYIKYGR